MSEPTWQDECHRAAALYESGKVDEAIAIFNEICARSDLGQSNMAMMLINLATIHEKRGDSEAAIAAMEQARTQSMECFFFVEQTRAGMLARIGRHDEAIALYESLLADRSLKDDARSACRTNIDTVRQMAGGDNASAVRYREAPRESL